MKCKSRKSFCVNLAGLIFPRKNQNGPIFMPIMAKIDTFAPQWPFCEFAVE